MSLHDRVEELIANLRQSGRILTDTRQALQARRVAWLSPRPSTLQDSADDLQELAERSAALENRRQEILERLAKELSVRARPGRKPHLTVTRIAAHLPASLAQRLRSTAKETTQAARGARLETMLGKRLLEFSRSAQEGVFKDLVGLQAEKAASGYDRNARNTAVRGGAGNLIDGRV